MPDLKIAVEGAEPAPFAVTPLLAIKLKLSNADAGEHIYNVMLQSQLQIETTRRLYDDAEQANLSDLFGEPQRWNQTLRPMLWTHASVNVRPFKEQTYVDLLVPCTFDFNVAATKYFDGLNQGDIPVGLLFSGTIFYEDDAGALSVAQIPWATEARFRLPITAWKKMMDHYYPNSAWLMLRRDVFDRLHRFKRERGLGTLEQAVEQLLP